MQTLRAQIPLVEQVVSPESPAIASTSSQPHDLEGLLASNRGVLRGSQAGVLVFCSAQVQRSALQVYVGNDAKACLYLEKIRPIHVCATSIPEAKGDDDRDRRTNSPERDPLASAGIAMTLEGPIPYAGNILDNPGVLWMDDRWTREEVKVLR